MRRKADKFLVITLLSAGFLVTTVALADEPEPTYAASVDSSVANRPVYRGSPPFKRVRRIRVDMVADAAREPRHSAGPPSPVLLAVSPDAPVVRPSDPSDDPAISFVDPAALAAAIAIVSPADALPQADTGADGDPVNLD